MAPYAYAWKVMCCHPTIVHRTGIMDIEYSQTSIHHSTYQCKELVTETVCVVKNTRNVNSLKRVLLRLLESETSGHIG